MIKVIITGVTGQDGSHMADYLLDNTDYEIYGGVRRLSVRNHANIKHLEDNKRFHIFDFELSDPHNIRNSIIEIEPDYFINFAAQSFVGVSWQIPRQTFCLDSLAVLDILESIRLFAPDCRFYNAGSSEEFGDVLYVPQDEKHPIRPRSPYGAAKASARHLVKVYRESYGIFAIQGWLFNHEGVRRGSEFVTRKITQGVARIYNQLTSVDNWRYQRTTQFDPISLGNIDSKRDWSDAQDFVHGIWLMLNNDAPKEYVLASGEVHSIRDFVETAFKCLQLTGIWHNPTGERGDDGYDPTKESYIYTSHGTRGTKRKPLVIIDSEFYRPNEVELLQGDPTLIRKELNYDIQPDFKMLVKTMVQNDLKDYFRRENTLTRQKENL